MGGVDFAASGLGHEVRERDRGAHVRRIAAGDDLRVSGRSGVDRRGEGTSVSNEHKTRGQRRENGLELGEVLGHQRIGRRNGRIGHARDHRAEAD